MVRIAVLASFNMDLVMRTARRPDAGETLQGDFAMHLGGKGFNQAVAAKRLGAEVGVVGRVGDDDFGRRFLDALDREAVDRSTVAVDAAAPTGVASIIVEGDGTNAIVQAPGANRRLTPQDVERGLARTGAVDAALLQLETSDDAAIAFAIAMRKRGAIVVLNPAPAARVPQELLLTADVIVPNEIEARAITGSTATGTDAQFAMAEALRAQGARQCVITLGAAGAIAIGDDGGRIFVSAMAVDVVDTVGAGDAFCAGLAVRLAEGAALADAVSFANAAGALACTRAGAEPSMPHRDAVEALLARTAIP